MKREITVIEKSKIDNKTLEKYYSELMRVLKLQYGEEFIIELIKRIL